MKKSKELSGTQLALLRLISQGGVHKPKGHMNNTFRCLRDAGYIAPCIGGYEACNKGKNYLHVVDNPANHPPAHLECRACFKVTVKSGVCTACGTVQNGKIKPAGEYACPNGKLVHSATLHQLDQRDY